VRETTIRIGLEYESRLFGGAYGFGRYNSAKRGMPIKAMIEQARVRYNTIRTDMGLEPVTDWSKTPTSLVQKIREDG